MSTQTGGPWQGGASLGQRWVQRDFSDKLVLWEKQDEKGGKGRLKRPRNMGQGFTSVIISSLPSARPCAEVTWGLGL